MVSSPRQLVFISHANPEENEFTRWLGMHLTRHGYQIWSDVTKLIGGEIWWNDIEEAIRNHTAKFLFVLSRASNTKPGTRAELHLALNAERQHKLRDFVVPLLVDDQLRFGDINIQLGNRNAISFVDGWANGLARVLEKLCEDQIPQDADSCSPTTVATWWQEHIGGQGILIPQPATYLSNWFPVTRLPDSLRIIDLEGHRYGHSPANCPAHRIRQYLVSFAPATSFGLTGHREHTVSTAAILSQDIDDLPLAPHSVRYCIVRLLRLAWGTAMRDLGMSSYMMANERHCFYFTDELLAGRKRLPFDIPGCASGRRGLTGDFRGHRWHFGVSADFFLDPHPVYVLRGHVLFSDDGKSIWNMKGRLHTARRSACKTWWNDRWRDMLLLTMSWLSERQGTDDSVLRVRLSNEDTANVSICPVQFESPVTYEDAEIAQDEADDDDLDSRDDVTDYDASESNTDA